MALPLSRFLILSLLASSLSVGCSRDRDNDGYKSGVGEGADCDDEDADINPGATEICDGADNDCDTVIDEADAEDAATWYYDGDADGFGDDAVTEKACSQPANYASAGGDCDDTNPYLNPDTLWYADTDNDTFGDPNVSIASCEQPSGYVEDNTDCDDTRDDVNPAEEEQCDEIDHNCNGDNGMIDTDLDGWAECEGDCDDTLATVYPGADEYCNGYDDDCDDEIDEDSALDAPTWYLDYDQDTFGGAAYAMVQCYQPDWFVGNADDCNDLDAETYPGAPEQCDEEDNDCDGDVDEAPAIDAPTWYMDGDADGYGTTTATITDECTQPSGYADNPDDCDDTRFDSNPGAPEYCNGYDDDCDGTTDENSAVDVLAWYLDSDTDGYGNAASATFACSQPTGYAGVSGDCDDTDAAISPAADEYCDGVDNNCNGVTDESTSLDADTWYADSDADTYGDPTSPRNACAQPSGYVADATDCDDTAADVNPGAAEICNDGIDNDCSGGFDACTLDAMYADTIYLGGAGEQGGRYITNVGDLNADGLDEIMIGVRSGAGTAGMNYIFEGPISAVGAVTLGDGSEAGTVQGASTALYAAVSATGGRDLDGDGVDDYAIGSAAPNTERGAVWLYFGEPAVGLTTDDADALYTGVVAYDRAGGPNALAFLSDIDGDGHDDMAVGAYTADPTGLSNAGKVYVVYGPIATGTSASFSTVGDVIDGEAVNDNFGSNVLDAGDVDGDGLHEVAAVSVPAMTNAGRIYVFEEAPSGHISATSADLILQGEDTSDFAGIGMAAAGDQDGDGLDDLLVGATRDDRGAADGGCVYVVTGAATSGSLADAYITRFYGTTSSGSFGASTAGVDDYYADHSGVPAVLAGATYQGSGMSGKLYLFLGSRSGNVPDTDADVVLTGTAVGDQLGAITGFSGDIDGAGTPVVMTSTYYADQGGTDAGAAYLFFGFEE